MHFAIISAAQEKQYQYFAVCASDVWYEIFYILTITIIAQKIYHDMI